MLWLYTYEGPDYRGYTDELRDRILDLIWNDTSLYEFTLPFFRYRVQWFSEQFQAGKMDALTGYLSTWADEKDSEADRQMIELLESHSDGRGKYGIEGTAEKLRSSFERWKDETIKEKMRRKVLEAQEPAWEQLLYGDLEFREVCMPMVRAIIDKLSSEGHGVTSPASAQMKQPPIPAIIPPVKAPPAPQPQDQNHSWLLWLLAVFAALGGLGWRVNQKTN